MASSSVPPKLSTHERMHYRNFLLFLLSLVFLYLIKDFIWPVLLGAVFAIVMYPVHRRFLSHGINKTVSGLLVTIIFAVAFLIPVGGLIFAGADAGLAEMENLRASMAGWEEKSTHEILDSLGLLNAFNTLDRWVPGDQQDFIRYVKQGAITAGRILGNLLKEVLQEIPKALIASVVIVFAVYYFLVDGARATRWLSDHSLLNKSNTNLLFSKIHDSCHSAILASVMTGLLQTGIMGVGCVITGVPNLILVLLVTFTSSFLPMIGTGPVTVAIILYFAFHAMWAKAIVFVGVGALIGISDNFARPYFIGRGTEIHPLIAFVFTFGAVTTIGFYGLFIGPVAAGTLLGIMSIFDKTKKAQQEETLS